MMPERREKRLPEKDGVFFLIYKDGKVLLEERLRDDKPYFGYTTIPGGKVERGLTHEETALKEAREECDIYADKVILLDNFLEMTITNQLYNVSAYLITSYKGEPTNVEGKSRQFWADLNDADKLVSFVESRYVILLAKNYLAGENC